MADVKKLAEELTKLTVLEVNELKNVLKDEYGIEPAAAAVAVAAAPAGEAGAAAATRRLNGTLT
jgi:large subunit ribosomal protein L7/L12